MSIPADAIGTPLPRFNGLTPFVDKNGVLTEHGLQTISALRDFIVGMNRVTPCSASGTNVITLTPNDAAPLIEKYVDYEIYGFVAANNSTGLVMATVVPAKGALATRKVFKVDGSTQITAGDIVAGSFYWLVYNDAVDGSAGGFVLK